VPTSHGLHPFLGDLAGRASGAEPIAVRWAEGPTYGLVALSSFGGEVLADGELIQTVKRHSVESRLTFLKFEGSMFLNGPIWRIEPSPARWSQ
jgi:hypothetical protein